jgi:hypothetical protein
LRIFIRDPLMCVESYDMEVQDPPSTRIFETFEHSHMHEESQDRGIFEDTSICIMGMVDLHVEVDPVV